MKSKQHTLGFTLVELMIVVGIIGVLASIAIPTYRKYVEKARFAEVMTMASRFKLPVSLALQEGVATASITNGQNGIPAAPAATENVASVVVQNAVITATATATAGGYTFILTPDSTGGIWTVTGTCVAAAVCK